MFILLGLFLGFFSIETTVIACTTVVVGKGATQDGSIIIARNSDTRSPARAKHLKIYPAQSSDHAQFLGLPYHDTDSVDGMLQVATNSFGVAISATETIYANSQTLQADPYTESGVEEANVTAPVMSKARTARHAIELIGARIEAEGAAEGVGIAVADRNEVWYLENASGHHWAAVRVPDDSFFVSANQGRLQHVKFKSDGTFDEGFLGSKGLLAFAQQHNLYREKNNQFDFRLSFHEIRNDSSNDSHSDPYTNYLRLATLLNQLGGYPIDGYETGDFPTFMRPSRKIKWQDVAQALSNFFEGTEQDSYTTPGKRQEYRPVAVFNASNSHVTVLRDLGSANLAIENIEYIALGMPTLSLYVPFYPGIQQVPQPYTLGGEQADSHSAFWKFRKVQALAFKNYAQNYPIVKSAYQELSTNISQMQTEMETRYLSTHDPELIQKFTNEAVALSLETAEKLRIQLEKQYPVEAIQASRQASSFGTNSFYDKITKRAFKRNRFHGKDQRLVQPAGAIH